MLPLTHTDCLKPHPEQAVPGLKEGAHYCMPGAYVISSNHYGLGDLSDLIKQCSLTLWGTVWEISKKYAEW